MMQAEPCLAMITPSDEGEQMAEAQENWFQAVAQDSPFALELVGTDRVQGFVLRATGEAELTMLISQLQAQYPQAEIKRIADAQDPLKMQRGEHAVVGEFALTSPSWMPLKTFSGKTLTEAGSDPLAGLLAAMQTVGARERIICQLALVRAPDHWIAPALRRAVEHPLQQERDRFAASLKSGGDASGLAQGWRILFLVFAALATAFGYRLSLAGMLLPVLIAGPILGFLALVGLIWWNVRKARTEIYDMKLVAEKLMRSAFYMQLRVIVIGKANVPKETLRTHLDAMQVAYRQFSLASANSLSMKKVRYITAPDKRAQTLPSAAHAFAYHHPLLRFLHRGWSKDVCNGLELAGMFHLPQQFTDLPLVQRIAVKHLLFEPNVAQAIEETKAPLPPVTIGVSQHRGLSVSVRLPYTTQFSHKFLVGRSRYGKSVLIQLLASGAMRPVSDGTPTPGIFCIDPHRDLIFDLLKQIPSARAKDVLLLDFTEATHIVGLNPLDATQGLTRDQMIASLMSCFERIWEKYWGPRMSFFLKNICLLLITLNFKLCQRGKAEKQYTLLDINPVLQYKEYATLVLNQLDKSETWHQELLAWFQHTYWTLPTNSSFRQEIILPILSKMATFNDNMQLRRIFGQAITTASVHRAITQGKIVLCALSSRDMDEASVNILGSTLINTLHYAFTRQQEVPLMKRRKCAVFIDELQNFTGSQFSKLLSEDAKWGCAALFTTQNLKRLNQLQDGLQEMLLSNCENLFAFNVSAADAKILAYEFAEKVTEKHIISQPRLHCYARISIAGHPLQWASLTLAQPSSWTKDERAERLARQIQLANHRRFKDAASIDAEHEAHLSQFLDVSHFADRIAHDAKTIVSHRASQEKQRQREQELLHQSLVGASSKDVPDLQTHVHDDQAEEPDDEAETLAFAASLDPSSPGNVSEQKRKKRTRSRRQKKKPMGTASDRVEDDQAEVRPRASMQTGFANFGGEGRERERGA